MWDRIRKYVNYARVGYRGRWRELRVGARQTAAHKRLMGLDQSAFFAVFRDFLAAPMCKMKCDLLTICWSCSGLPEKL